MVKGFVGKILRVDLTSGSITSQELPEEGMLRSYIGCLGLGLRILYDELPPGYNVTDPETPMIFMTGPLTGTKIPCSNNLTLVTKHADTNFTLCRSHSHGFFGPHLKFAGWDGLIITGQSKKPVYLWIHNDEVEIRDARKIWGRDTHETEDLVKEAVGQPKASVAAIGPAGENLCAGSLIENDKNHLFSQGGKLMGSKKLKAIAVFGTHKIPIFDEARHKAAQQKWMKLLKDTKTSTFHTSGRGGIPRGNYARVKSAIGVSAKNWRTTHFPEFGMGLSDQKITPRPCFNCPIACSYDAEIVTGKHKGHIATLTGGGEAQEGSSSLVGISDPGSVFYLTDLYDRLGIDGSTAGCTIAMAFEAYEKGYITKEDNDGLELVYGDEKVVEKMIRKYVSREGFGDILARGPKEAAEFIGHDAPDFAINIKGAGMNLHDWRSAWGVLLGQIVSSGGGWLSGAADCWRAEPDAGYPEKTARMTQRGKGEEVARCAIMKALNDSIGLCWYASWGLPGILNLQAEAISAVTGWEITSEELRAAGERILNLERCFNVRNGLTPEDDYSVSRRITEEPPDGPGKGKSIGWYLKGMINDYYHALGWDPKTGRPWRSTLNKLGMKEIADSIWGK
jgi:aldehyde:ferredoxin oxidoreductase